MTPQKLSEAYWRLFEQFYKTRPIIKRFLGYQKGGVFEQLFYDLYVSYLVRKMIHPWKGKTYTVSR
jgi:hypothetical protein